MQCILTKVGWLVAIWPVFFLCETRAMIIFRVPLLFVAAPFTEKIKSKNFLSFYFFLRLSSFITKYGQHIRGPMKSKEAVTPIHKA